MRVFLCLISVLSLSCAQLLLDNTIELDPEGTFRLDWSVIYDNATNPLIRFETIVQTQGWVSLRWTRGQNADFFWGNFYEINRNNFEISLSLYSLITRRL